MTSKKSRRIAFFTAITALFFGASYVIPAVYAESGSSSGPSFGHVVVVVGSNRSYSQTYDAGTMPYLDALAAHYGLATNYTTDTHSAIGDSFVLTTGHILTNNDAQTPLSFPVSVDNIALDAQRAGKTWKDYMENLPSDSCSGLNMGDYSSGHDPFAYMTNINQTNRVCFSQFPADMKNGALPSLSWLVPNNCDDGQSCGPGTFDKWLKTEMGPLLASKYFQPGASAPISFIG